MVFLLRITFITLFNSLLLCLPILVRVAFFTLLERKFLSLVGVRVGPNKVSFLGVLQPIGDALKLANKRINMLRRFSFFFYYLRSSIIIFRSLILFRTLFIEPCFVSFKFSILVFFIVLGLNSFNSILRGWRTFRKFSLLGSLRTVSQLISYEASLYLCIFLIVMSYSCFDLTEIFSFHFPFLFFLVPILGFIWIPVFLAELNRSPYDFSEGERELVRGFNTEFGSSSFTLIFLAEYGNILFFCFFTGVIFFSSPLGILFFFLFVIWIRSVLPRFRFDKLMRLAWKSYIPFLTCLFIFYFLILL